MRHAARIIFPLGLAALAGCRSAAELEPAERASSPPADMRGFGEASAFTTVDQVEIAASAADWPGPSPVRYEVTPIRVRLKNESARPLRVDYGQFELEEMDGGETYAAIAPFAVDGEVEDRRVVADPEPFEPAWYGRGYHVYDPFATYYRSPTSAWADPYMWADADWDYYDAYWGERELPTGQMIARALPPGVVEAGGEVDGWLFFEKVDEDAEKVQLEVELVEARSGERVGVARLAFDVEED